MSIIKPLFDKRNYKSGILKNNIKYVVINDNQLDKSYVSVNVKVGSFNDDKEYGGLAHFLEHMLFMGSEKYKDENYFNECLTKYDGISNAYTANYETCYYFTLFTKGLMEVIDIFSRFFIDPLFLQDSVKREVNAVNNEHLKNILSDGWIFEHFHRHLSSNRNIFTTGSLETLDKPNIREKLIEFYKTHYIANNISICVASNLSIDEMESIIVKTFNNIKGQENTTHANEGIIFIEKNKDYYLKSIANIYSLTYMWEIPEQISSNQIKTQEFQILARLLNSFKLDTLHFYLTNNGFINSLYAEVTNYGLFQLTFNLTEMGMQNIKFIDSILYHYIDLLYQEDINKIATHQNTIYQYNFDMQSMDEILSLANHISTNLHYYDLNKVYIGSTVYEEIFPTTHYHEMWKRHIDRKLQIRILQTQEYQTNKLIKLPHYDSQYCEITLPSGSEPILQKFIIYSTEPIQYIDKISLVNNLDVYQVPYLLEYKYWYGGSSKFNEPVVYMVLNFANNKMYHEVTQYIEYNLVCSIMNLLASLYFYNANKVGYYVTFTQDTTLSSININISSPNSHTKLSLFIKEIINFLQNIDKHLLQIADTLIMNEINLFKRNVKNIDFVNSATYANYILQLLQNRNEHSAVNILKIIDNIRVENIRKTCQTFLDSTSLTIFIYGNITCENALFEDLLIFGKKFNNCFYRLPKPNPFWLCDSEVCPIIKNTFLLSHPNKEQKTNCVTRYYNVGPFNPTDYILSIMTNDILHDNFFNELRTKKQLGYLVKMYHGSFLTNQYIVQTIQSDQSIDKVEEEIDNFNQMIDSFINEKEFESYKERVRQIINANDLSTAELYARYSYEIIYRICMFDRVKILLSKISNITFSDLKNFINKYINKKNCIKINIKGH